MKVADRMIKQVVTLGENATLRDALLAFQKHHIRHVPIVEGGKLVGIITDRDLKRATPSPFSGADRETFERVVDSTRVGQIMTRNPYTVTPSTPLRDAVKVLHDRKFGALPVVDGETLVGIVTATDMLKDLYDLLQD
ncbi:MAG: CBS domain-containing protein [Acidobacteria bacterium]|nr:CBS domain-containing protein [Acidobacteriota bacterium]